MDIGSEWMREALPNEELGSAARHALSQVEIDLHMYTYLLRRPRTLRAKKGARDSWSINEVIDQ